MAWANDQQDQTMYRFDIPQQRADTSLTQFATQAGITLIFPYEKVIAATANRLSGKFSLEVGIEKLLAGTSLAASFSDDGVLIINKISQPAHEANQMSVNRKAGLAAILAGFFSVGATAQDAPETDEGEAGVLEEVIVTSQRREQSLREVPISVTAFTSEMLRNNMISDLTSYFNKTPNVSYMQGGARSNRSISIRGVSDVGGLTSSFAVYVDEFNIANGPARQNDNNTNSSLNPQLQDIERIEVLRGPQGTFFGRNAAGGAINIITKKPTADYYAEGSLEYGRFNTFNIGGVLNGSLIEDKLFMRASLYYEQSDGFVRNIQPIGGDSGSDFTNYRLAAKWLPTDRLTVDLSVASSTENQGLDSSVGAGVLEQSSQGLAIDLGLTPPVLDGIPGYPENLTRVSQDRLQTSRNVFTVYTGRVEYAADNYTITSVTGYLDATHKSTIDLDLTSIDYFYQDANVASDTFSQELRIRSSIGENIDWVFGGLYAVDNLLQGFLASVGVGGFFFGLPDNLPLADGLIDTKRTSYAFFGEMTWHVNDRLALTVGGRYSDDTINRVENRLTFFTQLPEVSGEVSYSDLSPKFALTYDINDDVTFYAVASRGYKAGGMQTNIESPAFPYSTYEEESLWNYEGGIKAELLENRMYFGASVFYMDWQDLQVLSGQTSTDPDTGLIVFLLSTANAASASSKGVELELRALAAPGLEISAGLGYLDAKFEKFDDALIFGETYNLSGTPLPRAPKWTVNADAQYTFNLSDNLESFIRAEWSYRSETIPYFDATIRSGFPWRTPAFNVFNFRAGIVNKKYQLTAYVENAFNEQYFTGLDPTFGFAGPMIRPSQRIFGVRLTMHFE